MNVKKNSVIDVKINNIVLTPLSCAFLVNEFIKLLLYQKSQIPYPYNWLKTVVTRKRKSLEGSCVAHNNIALERHYNVVLSTYNAIEDILSSLKLEFRSFTNSIKEVLIIFGATPYTPKEVFRINIPLIDINHIEANHLKFIQRDQQKILRNILFSEDWLKAMAVSCPITNMYVMVRKHIQNIAEDNVFIPVRNYNVPQNCSSITVSLHYENDSNLVCCSNMSVFNDSSSSQHCEGTSNDIQISDDLNDCWFQAKTLVKGYKDCFINKMSATELF